MIDQLNFRASLKDTLCKSAIEIEDVRDGRHAQLGHLQ